jgi:hypothetical protein
MRFLVGSVQFTLSNSSLVYHIKKFKSVTNFITNCTTQIMESKQFISQYNNRSYASDYQFINSRVLSANTITNPPFMESKHIIMQKYNKRYYASDYQFINSRVLSANTITSSLSSNLCSKNENVVSSSFT